MTNTTPEAVDWDDIPDTPEQRALIAAHSAEMKRAYPNLIDLDSLSAQLEAAEAKLATAHSQGKAEGLREAADIVWSDIHNLDTWTRKFVRHALLSIIPADTPAEKVTVQEANKRVARARDEALMEAAGCIGHITRHEDLDAILALRVIAGGRDE